MELAAVDAGAPWLVNMACNAAINAETKTWDSAAILTECRSITVPALLVHGGDDPRPPFAIDDLSSAIPSAEVVVIDQTGHTPWLERLGAVASVVREWLARAEHGSHR